MRSFCQNGGGNFMLRKKREWMQFLLNKYGRDFLYNEERQHKNMSLMFKDIWKCREEVLTKNWISNKMFRWKMGEGSKIKFLERCLDR